MNYNLLSEKFITVKPVDGGTDVLSLTEVLEKAHRIKSLDYQYPEKTEMFCMYRFLTQLITDIFRPKNAGDIYRIFKNGCFDMDIVNGYFEKNWNRFNLFDEEYPFMQVSKRYFSEKKLKEGTKPIRELSPVVRLGNNDVFYNPEYHMQKEDDWTPEHVIYNLLLWAMCNVKTGQGNKAPILGGSGTTPVFTLYEGDSLFMTIILGMKHVIDTDIPYWRREYPEKEEQLPTLNSLMNYEFYPVTKILLDKDGFVDGRFTKVYIECDNTNPIFKYSVEELGKIKKALRLEHPSLKSFLAKAKKGEQSGEQFVEMSNTKREYWLYIATTLANKAVDDVTRKYSPVIEKMDEDDVAPEYLTVSYFGIYKGQTPPYKHIYAKFPDMPSRILWDSNRQEDTEKYVSYIERSGKILGEESLNYVRENSVSNKKEPPEEFVLITSRFFRRAQILFIDKYLRDENPNTDSYVSMITGICRDEFQNLTTIQGNVIAKSIYMRNLMGRLKKIKEEIYGSKRAAGSEESED